MFEVQQPIATGEIQQLEAKLCKCAVEGCAVRKHLLTRGFDHPHHSRALQHQCSPVEWRGQPIPYAPATEKSIVTQGLRLSWSHRSRDDLVLTDWRSGRVRFASAIPRRRHNVRLRHDSAKSSWLSVFAGMTISSRARNHGEEGRSTGDPAEAGLPGDGGEDTPGGGSGVAVTGAGTAAGGFGGLAVVAGASAAGGASATV
jgi:hypothetical protein